MARLVNKLFSLNTWQRILFALVAGTITGLALGPRAEVFKLIGLLFINAINMMIVPVVFTAIVCAILAMKDFSTMRRIWFKALCLYGFSMMVSAVIGLFVANLIKPGLDLHLSLESMQYAAGKLPSLSEQIVNIIPKNPFNAFASGNILQILVFAVFFGLSINIAGKAAEPVEQLFKAMSSVVFTFANLIMSTAPIGVFALLAWVFGKFGLQALLPLLKFVFTVYLGCIALILLYFFPSLAALTKISPIKFIQKIRSAAIFAFVTSSSAATLPESMRCVEKKLGVPHSLSGFLLPLGATLNLNGLSIYLSVATVFSANLFGIQLSFPEYGTLVIAIVLSAMGAAAVPGSALIVMGAVMASVGIPLSAMPLIAGVDRLNDMAQTSTNVIGDIFATTVIAHSERKIKEPEED